LFLYVCLKKINQLKFMATENGVLMRQAQEALSGKWALAIITCLVYNLFIGISLPMKVIQYEYFKITVGGIGLLLAGPFTLGISMFSLSLARKEDARFEQLFDGFSRFGVALLTYILMGLRILLWLLLLIVPGIIAAISYSQTFFILAEDSSIRPTEAIDKSKRMMDGHKMKYFFLCLRYLGLGLLCILTLGIGFLWLAPYIQVTNAKFYDDIKGITVSNTNI
jgi:uncharacterized membrane protein